MTGVIFVNPGAGPDSTPAAVLHEHFPGVPVLEEEPAALADAVRKACAGGAEWIGVAGGDGTIRTVAETLAGSPTPLLAIPAGTRNHFARDVGTPTLEAAAAAASGAGRACAVDLGRVNGRWFVNNASVGLYPWVVQRRRRHEHRFPKGVASALAAWEQLRHGRSDLDVGVAGRRYRASMVFVGNGKYGEGLTDLAARERLDTGCLDVRLVRADRRWARVRVVAALLTGRLSRSPLVLSDTPAAVELRIPGGSVEVALDGEVLALRSPLCFEAVPAALRVLVAGAE